MIDSSEKNLPTTISPQADCQKCNANTQVKLWLSLFSVYFSEVSLQVVLDVHIQKKARNGARRT